MNLDDYLAEFKRQDAVFEPDEVDRAIDSALAGHTARRGRSDRLLPRRAALVPLAAAVAISTGYVTAQRSEGPTSAPPSVVVATDEPASAVADSLETTELFATDTIADIVSWTDQLAVVTVMTSDPSAPPDGLSSGGEDDGLLNRTLTLRVDRTIWARTGAAKIPASFESTAWGWVVTAGNPELVRPAGEISFEVGKQYVVSLALEGTEWLTLGQASFELGADGTLVGPPDGSQFTGALNKRTLEAAGEILDSTEPLAGVEQFITLPLKQRLRSWGRFVKSAEGGEQ